MTASAPPTTVQELEALTAREVDARYRPFLHAVEVEGEGDWVDQLELDTVRAMSEVQESKIKLLVLYGSLRSR